MTQRPDPKSNPKTDSKKNPARTNEDLPPGAEQSERVEGGQAFSWTLTKTGQKSG